MPAKIKRKSNNFFLPKSYSKAATQATFNRLKAYMQEDRWLAGGNRYARKCVERIKTDCDSNPRKILDKQLAEYIAASAPLHAVDGWSLLGKAIVSHSLGDVDACKHFSYYAQLRAVMSIMASEGIGIFLNKHFAIKNADGRTSSVTAPKGTPTHEFAETQFKSWANSKKSGELLENIIRPRGHSLEEWFKEISPTKIGWLAQNWLKHWGYDLKKFKKDRDARNRASYRPTILDRDLDYRNASVTKESIELIQAIWRMCAPEGIGSFSLDMQLLRASWDEYSKMRGISPSRTEREKVLNDLGILQPELGRLLDFFERKISPEDSIVLTEARKQGSPEDEDYHSQMLCRAALLLRLATGASSSLLAEAKIFKSDLKFWTDFIGENAGLWEAGIPDPIADMWIEVEEALQNLDTKGSTINNHYQWRLELASEVLVLSGCERIGLSQFCI